MGLKKSRARAQIIEASSTLKQVMQDGLAVTSAGIIDQVMRNYRNSTDSQRFNATKGITVTAANEYKASVLDAFSVIAADAITQARKEVPSKKNVRLADEIKLSDFDSLPAGLRNKILALAQQLTGKQLADLQSYIFFQYQNSIDSTDDEGILEADLEAAAQDYIESSGLSAGASTMASRLVNDSRDYFFSDDQVAPEIVAYQFVNGDPVTEICQELAGTVFPSDQPDWERYQPPLHWNCKSVIIPVIGTKLDDYLSRSGQDGLEDIGSSKSSKWFDDRIQFHEHEESDRHLCGLRHRTKGT